MVTNLIFFYPLLNIRPVMALTVGAYLFGQSPETRASKHFPPIPCFAQFSGTSAYLFPTALLARLSTAPRLRVGDGRTALGKIGSRHILLVIPQDLRHPEFLGLFVAVTTLYG